MAGRRQRSPPSHQSAVGPNATDSVVADVQQRAARLVRDVVNLVASRGTKNNVEVAVRHSVEYRLVEPISERLDDSMRRREADKEALIPVA
jgi:hypothetical protein